MNTDQACESALDLFVRRRVGEDFLSGMAREEQEAFLATRKEIWRPLIRAVCVHFNAMVDR